MRATFLLLVLCRLSYSSTIISQQSDSVDLFGRNVKPFKPLSPDNSLLELLMEIEPAQSENIDGEFEDADLPSSEEITPINNGRLTELFFSALFADSGLDSIVDKILNEANKLTKEKRKHEQKLPDVTPEFVKKLFGTTLSVGFSAKDGLAIDRSTLQRTGPSSIVGVVPHGIVTVNMSIGLKVANVTYKSCQLIVQSAKINAGNFTASLKENSVTAQVELNLHKCKANLKSLTIDKLSDLQLHLSGLSKFTNWVANKVANTLLNTSQHTIKKFLSEHIFKSVQESLEPLNVCKFW